jgi:hypothetical protein
MSSKSILCFFNPLLTQTNKNKATLEKKRLLPNFGKNYKTLKKHEINQYSIATRRPQTRAPSSQIAHLKRKENLGDDVMFT